MINKYLESDFLLGEQLFLSDFRSLIFGFRLDGFKNGCRHVGIDLMFSIFSMLKVFNLFHERSFMRFVVKVAIFAGLFNFLFSVSVFSQTILNSFPSPGPEPRGLAWDGSFLWCAEYSSGKIFKLNPSTGAKVDSFSFQIESAFGGITWGSDDQIWVANGGLIYEIDPASGETLSSFSCPGG